MWILVDLVVVGFIALLTYWGYKKGLTMSIFKIVSFILALLIALCLYKPVSNIIIKNTNLNEQIKTVVSKKIIADQKEQGVDIENDENIKDMQVKTNLPKVVDNYINKELEKTANSIKTSAVDLISEKISNLIINIATLLILFIITKLLLLFARVFIEGLAKLPIIKQFDKLGGIAFGFLKGLLIVWVALLAITMISSVDFMKKPIETIEQSYISGYLYDNNVILKFL